MTDSHTSSPTPYPELNAVLEELVARARRTLGSNFLGAYLQGSFAVGDFDRHRDVDFVIVTEDELSSSQVDALQSEHEEIYALDSAWARHLGGSYFPRAVLRDLGQGGDPLWYLDHGSRALARSAHDNTVVVRWILREKGVVLEGPAPSMLIHPIAVFPLQRDIWDTIHRWGGQILADPDEIRTRFYQGFAVLSYCRMLHDLHAGAVGSKRTGAEWAKAHLDPSWSDLIDRARESRPDPERSSREPADEAELARTLEFVREAIRMSDEFQAKRIAAGWEAYYEEHEGRKPRPLLLDALSRMEADRGPRARLQAIDLGCGNGIETHALLEAGWRVLAIDDQPAAIEHILAAVGAEHRPRLETRLATFEEIELPEADLIWAGYSLPFSKPERFEGLWAKITGSLRTGGRFAGQLFGVRDSWASEPEMTFYSAEQVRRLLADAFDAEILEETEEDAGSGDGPKHWHLFDIIARKRAL